MENCVTVRIAPSFIQFEFSDTPEAADLRNNTVTLLSKAAVGFIVVAPEDVRTRFAERRPFRLHPTAGKTLADVLQALYAETTIEVSVIEDLTPVR